MLALGVFPMPEMLNLPSQGSPAQPMEGSRSVRPSERVLIVACSSNRGDLMKVSRAGVRLLSRSRSR